MLIALFANIACGLAARPDALEAREVPAVVGWWKVGPQPEPPTVAKTVRFDPEPVLSRAPVANLLPALRPKVGAVPSDPVVGGGQVAILFPVFVPRR